MTYALIIWLGSTIFGLLLSTYLLYRTEKTHIKRWGASGKIFKYWQ